MSVEELVKRYVEDGMSTTQLAKLAGVSVSTVRARLLDAGVLRTRADAVRLAETQGRVKHVGNKGAKRTPEQRERIRRAAVKRGEHAAGVSVKPSGYVEYTTGPNKGRSVHVVTMEEHIGRRLAPDEVVHHINRDRSDNRLENLQLMTRSAHTELHRREDVR